MSSMTIKSLLPSPRYTCHDATVRHLTLPKQRKLPILGAYKSTPTPRAATTQSSGSCVVCHFSTELLAPTFSRVMTVSLWQWTPNVITTCWKPFSYLSCDVATGIWREHGFSRTVPQPIQHDSQWTPYVLHSPGEFSLGLVTFSGPPIRWTLLQQTFLAYYAWPRTYPSRSCKRNPWRQHVHRTTRHGVTYQRSRFV